MYFGCVSAARVHIFVLGCHLEFGNCGGLERGTICRGSRREVDKGGGGRERKILSALCSGIMPAKSRLRKLLNIFHMLPHKLFI